MPSTAEDRVLYRSTENLPVLRAYGAALRRARHRQGMTQAQLAARVGIEASTVGLIECGTLDASLTLWMDIAQALGIPLAVVLGSAIGD